MKSPLNLMIKGAVLLLLLLSLGLNSCKKSVSKESTDNQGSGTANITVQMLGIDENSGSLTVNGAGGGKLAVNDLKIQTVVASFNKDYVIEATLVPAGSAANSETNPALNTNATNSGLKTAAANPVQTPLTTNVKYKVVVYDVNGNYVTFKDFVRGSEGTTSIPLDAGKKYTFVAYSVNSTTDLPDAGLTAASTLSNSNLNGVSVDLMYFRSQQLTLTAGDNNLGIVLKHMYNLITPKIALGTDMTGNIDAISDVKFGGTTSPFADMNLGTGVLTYNTGYVLTAASSLTGIGTRTVTGSAILVINKGTSATPTPGTSRLAIGSITIAGITKTLSITGLAITPGVKYNLNLTIHRTCGTLAWDAGANLINISAGAATTPGETISKEYIFSYDVNKSPISTVVFYVSQLDESFQMYINNIPLLIGGLGDNEFKFNPGTGSSAPNVAATDGRRYGTTVGANTYLRIEQVVTNPMTGVTPFQIDFRPTAGQAQISGTTFGNLVLTSGYSFNPAALAAWHYEADNTIKVTQKLLGSTTAFKSSAAVTIPCGTN